MEAQSPAPPESKVAPRKTRAKRRATDVPGDGGRGVLRNLKQRKGEPLPSDYVRQTRLADNKRKSQASHEAKKKQKQIEDDENLAIMLAAEAGSLEFARVAYKYKMGADLLEDPTEVRNLPTKMRWLHDWYKGKAATKTAWFGLCIPEYIYQGVTGFSMWVELECLFQLF
jgi:hypothetical protein